MYLTKTKALAVKAVKETLDASYVEPDFRSVQVSLEYPDKSQSIPCIWVNFDPIGPLRPVGVGYSENVVLAGGPEMTQVTRWSYAGNITYTIVAMSSLERDRLFDEMVAVLGLGQFDSARSTFRTLMENDPLIAIQVNYDEVEQRGFSAAPGTPWGTADFMYECTLSVQATGEFVSAVGTNELLPISSIQVIPWAVPLETDPMPDGTWIG